MNIHHIDLAEYRAKSRGNGVLYLGTAGSHGNEQLEVTLDEGWEGLTVQAIFHPSEVAVQLPADGLLDVPWEATAKPLTAIQGRIVFQGFNQDRLVNTIDLAYTVAQHSSAVGRDEKPYTPGIVEGVLNRMAADKEEIMSAAQQAVQAKDTAQQAVEEVKHAAEKALDDIAAAAPALPAVSAANAGQTVTVNSNGTGYQLSGPFLPAEAGIRPTVSGNPAVCKDSIAWNLRGLKIYGKSVQNGTPGPENPVPIENAGDSGSIALSITDGAEQSQKLVISTPSGLFGIPTQKKGNYTDAAGNQWLCDVIDLDAKNIIKNCYTKIFKKEDFISFSNAQDCNRFVFSVKQIDHEIYIARDLESLCNKFHYDAKQISGNFWVSTNGQYGWGGYARANFYVPVSIASIDAFMEYVGDDLTIQMYDPFPKIEPISSEEICAYEALTAYNGTTVIGTDEPVAGIEAAYLADGAKYLKSVTDRIAALEAARTVT